MIFTVFVFVELELHLVVRRPSHGRRCAAASSMPRNFDHLSPENDDEEKFGRLGVRPHGFFPGQRVQIADL